MSFLQFQVWPLKMIHGSLDAGLKFPSIPTIISLYREEEKSQLDEGKLLLSVFDTV